MDAMGEWGGGGSFLKEVNMNVMPNVTFISMA